MSHISDHSTITSHQLRETRISTTTTSRTEDSRGTQHLDSPAARKEKSIPQRNNYDVRSLPLRIAYHSPSIAILPRRCLYTTV